MVIVFGVGFTGLRLSRRLLDQRVNALAAVRGIERFRDLANSGLRLVELSLLASNPALLPQGAVIALLIPPLPDPENMALRKAIERSAPARIVYVSSTGVYGSQIDVDAETPAQPNDARGRRRLEEEKWIASGPWTSLILRAAAIYGPGRGVQAALRAGRMPRGSDSSIVSRIHVDDLAAIVEAGLFRDIQGAWPLADDEPCATVEIVGWCLDHWSSNRTLGETSSTGPTTAMQGRRVDGRKIRELLGVQLKYTSWRTGVRASLLEEEMQERESAKLPSLPEPEH